MAQVLEILTHGRQEYLSYVCFFLFVFVFLFLFFYLSYVVTSQ